LPGSFPTPSFSVSLSGAHLAGGADSGGPSLATPVVTNTVYNVFDQPTTSTTGTQTRTYGYDALGRRTSSSTPELAGGAVTMQYNDLGLLTQTTDVRGVITTYAYDTLNRPVSISYNVGSTGVPATPSVGYTYGTSAASLNNGRLLTLTDGSGSETYTYDNMGRKTRCDKVINGVTYTTQYQYNLAGEVTQIQYPSSRQVKPAYDTIGRLSAVSDTLNSVNTTYASGYTYNVAQQITQFTYGNGVVANFGYSTDGRQQLTSLQYTKGAQTLFGLNYGYIQGGGNNGQITHTTDLVDNGRTTTYLYDALGRLTQAFTAGSAAFPNWDLAFSYDQYGNRTDETPQADTSPNATVPSNHLLFTSNPQNNRITTGGYAYDANGNMTNDGANTLVYDAANQVVSSNAGADSYYYDASGLRARKCGSSCASSSTIYVYAESQLIAEYDNGAAPGAPSREYINVGGKLAKIEAGSLQYYHPDHLSIRALSDSNGNKIAERGGFPYGEQWYSSGPAAKFQFTSYERDLNETGNDYAGARYYLSRLGRFNSPDPLDSSFNGFSYVVNDPVNHTDSSGMVCDDDCVFNGMAAAWGGMNGNCTLDGMQTPCETVKGMLNSGAAVPCGDCFNVTAHDYGDGTAGLFRNTYSNELVLNCSAYGAGFNARQDCQWSNRSLQWIADWDVPINPNYDIWHCPAADGFMSCQQTWVTTDKVGKILAVGTAVVPLIPAVVGEVATGGTVTVAVGEGSPFHVAYGTQGTWLNALGDFFGMRVTQAYAAETAETAWFTFNVPVLNEAAVLATEGCGAWSCATAAITAIAKGWIPFF